MAGVHFQRSLLILALLFCAKSFAGEIASIPFEFANGLIWVKPSGSDLNLVLDSGAGSNVLSLEAVRRMGIRPGSAVPVQAVTGRVNAYRVKAAVGELGGIPLGKEFLAMDLQAASKRSGRTIDGIIGRGFFDDRVVCIDFKRHRILWLDRADTECCVAAVPLRRRNDAFCIPVGVNGQKPRWVRVDTGCNSSLEWTARMGEPQKTGRSVGLAPFAGKSTPADIQLGDENIRNVQTVSHREPFFSGEAGLLGNGVLSRYRVTIDSLEMRLLLERL